MTTNRLQLRWLNIKSIYENNSLLEDVMEENVFFIEVTMKNNITKNKHKKS